MPLQRYVKKCTWLLLKFNINKLKKFKTYPKFALFGQFFIFSINNKFYTHFDFLTGQILINSKFNLRHTFL